MSELRYKILLPPITKKNSQQILTNRKTGRPFIMPSAKYKQYEREAAWFLKPRPPRPIECTINVKCLFYMPTRRRTDLNNLLEAVTDLLVHEKIIADDHYGIVAAHDGSRCFWDKDNPRTEIIISRMPNDQLTMLEVSDMRETLTYQQRLAIAKAYEQFRLLHQLEDDPMTLLAFLQANDLLDIFSAARFADENCGIIENL